MPTEKKIAELFNKISSLRSLAAACRGRKKDVKEQITELEKKQELNKLFNHKELLSKMTKKIYSNALKLSSIAHQKLNPKTEKQIKLFYLQRLLSQTLESHIERRAKSLNVRAIIDKELVAEVINE